MIAAGGLAQEVCSATTVRPSSNTKAPTTHDHTGSASKSDSNVFICGARTAAVKGMMVRNGPRIRANVCVRNDVVDSMLSNLAAG